MAKYRILKRGASHTSNVSGEYRRFGYNDVIELDEKSVKAGLYDHLKLDKVSGDTPTTYSRSSEFSRDEKTSLIEKKQDEDKVIEKESVINTLILETENATTARDIAIIVDKIKSRNLLDNPPGKKAELLEELNRLLEK